MPKFKPRTKNQNAYFHSLLNNHKNRFDAEAKAQFVFDITNGRTDSSAKMSFDEMNFGIERLGGTPFPVISGSRRTLNYRRQQSGNVDEVLHQEQKDKITKLCKDRISDERLAGISRRACGKGYPVTVKHGQKVIEALKVVIRRESNTTKKEAA